MSVHLQLASFSFAALLNDRKVDSSPELAFEVTKDGKNATLTKQLVLIAQESGSTCTWCALGVSELRARLRARARDKRASERVREREPGPA